MTLEEDQIRVRWPGPADQPDPSTISEDCKAANGRPTMEGTYLPNPFLTIPVVSNLKRGTVHPFGGCCLADAAENGWTSVDEGAAPVEGYPHRSSRTAPFGASFTAGHGRAPTCTGTGSGGSNGSGTNQERMPAW